MSDMTKAMYPPQQGGANVIPAVPEHAVPAPLGMPALMPDGRGVAPKAPGHLEDFGLDVSVLSDLALKLASTVPHLTTDWAAAQLHMPIGSVEQIYWQLKEGQFVEVLGQAGAFSYTYAITQRGREYAQRLLEVSGYVGPAPVSLEAYSAMLQWQLARRPRIAYDQVRQAIAGLVLPEAAVEVAALATSSGRSLFLFGPPGNGKTSLCRQLHRVLGEALWIPYCIAIGSNVIRLYDPHCHESVAKAGGTEPSDRIDRRWVKIKPPLVVAGGELVMEDLDLIYSPTFRLYEAPPHLKANGGTFLLDDFGRQRMEPHELLNRWIIPLERQIDYLALKTGQRIQVPFRPMLVVATNLPLDQVADPAFLRRMGYRLQLDRPSPQAYTAIFQAYAASLGLSLPADLLPSLLARYAAEGRNLRCSEPRDLIDRAGDLCRLHGRPLTLDQQTLGMAWTGYFGQPTPPAAGAHPG